MWRVLGAIVGGVGESVDGLGDVAGHGEVDGSGGVVPLESEAAVERAGPVGGNFILELEGVDQVLGVFGADVLHSEVVDNEGEGDGACGMVEEAGSVGGGGVAVFGEMVLEAVVHYANSKCFAKY